MQRTCAAKGDENVVARIDALFDGPNAIAFTMFSSAIRMTASAVSSVRIRAAASQAPDRRDRMFAVRGYSLRSIRSERRRPRSTFASVTWHVPIVARNRRAQDRSATRGPTRRNPPRSTHAIDPPPAPIVDTSIVGNMRGRPIDVRTDQRSVFLRSLIRARSQLVPPMSSWSIGPADGARSRAPITPPARPDRESCDRSSRRLASHRLPPFDLAGVQLPFEHRWHGERSGVGSRNPKAWA